MVAKGFEDVGERLEKVETRLDGVETRLENVETGLGKLENESQGLRSSVNNYLRLSDERY